MSHDKMKQLVGSLAKKVEDSQKIALPIVAMKLAKYLEAYPHDHTLGAMSRIVENMVSNNTFFIRKAEFKDLYHKLHTRNTKFAQFFTEELGIQEESPAVELAPLNPSGEIQIAPQDSSLANALAHAFDHTVPVQKYAKKHAESALKSVSSSLDAWNASPTELSVADGSDKFIVLKADYETPKGVTGVYIPVEIVNDKVMSSDIFMSNAGISELNNNNIKSYITSHAGQKLLVSGSTVLNVLVKASSKNEISDTDLALAKVNADKAASTEFAQNQIVGQKLAEEARKDVQLPKAEQFKSFEEKFSNEHEIASFTFGEDKIKTAKDSLARDLVGFGYTKATINVIKSNQESVLYGVSLDSGKVAFTVPVKITKGKITKPNVMVCNGSVMPFTGASINKMYVDNQSDHQVAAAVSPLFGLKSSDLLDNVRKSIAEGNHAAAEDALNVLASNGDSKAYAVGFQLLMDGLTHKTAEKTTTCSLIVKNSSSQHPICGHTGLPLHKTYQDKHGNCRPLYRRGMDETYEGVTFNTSKIFG